MKLYRTILVLITLSLLFNAEVNREDARKVAENTFNKFKNESMYNFKVRKLDMIESDEKVILFYIFNLDPVGFIIISAEDKTLPVFAYSFENNFNYKSMPASLENIFNSYKKDIQDIRNSNDTRRGDIQNSWEELLADNVSQNRSRNVSPMINARFDQGGNWNNLIPSSLGWNVPVGCVAVAMGQVMHHWKHPYVGEGYNSYTDDGVFLEADFSSAYYDFDNMPATYASDPSRLLLFHAGISVNMDYDQSGSGAWVMGSYPSTEYSLEYNFKYHSDMYHMYKTSNNTDIFLNAIKEDLNNNMPVIMVGYGAGYGGGHAWNVDGYQGNVLHCNWGWGGSSNGYFNLTSMGGFPDDQSVLLNIIPRDIEAPISLFEYTTDASTVYFTDLSSIVNEYELRNYYWDFGDGTSEITTSGEISHTYTLSGSYDVELIVENIYGMMSQPFYEQISVNAATQGDINQDTSVNVLDVIMLVNFILGGDPSASEIFIGDLNSDNMLNIQDIIMLVNIIVG